MKQLSRLLLAAAALPVFMAAGAATPVAPTVPVGSFHCFPGMPKSAINYVESPASRQMRVDKLGNSKWDNADGHDLREVPCEGTLRVPVILVNFADREFIQGKDPHGVVDDMLNGDNFTYENATGSARKYFQTISDGQFNPQFDVYGPVTVSKAAVEYVTPTEPDTYIDPVTGKEVNVYPASRMVEEAVKLAGIEDLSVYDLDKNGEVDFVYLFYAGKGATTGGNQLTTIWPHAFTLTAGIGAPVKIGDYSFNRYCCSAELGRNNRLSGIGTFVHEFSHVLGLPDLYDTANNGSVNAAFSPGPFSCMDAGNYNNEEHTPPYYSTYEQYALEWMKPVTLAGAADITMLPMGAKKFGYKVNTVDNEQEYFLLENRDTQGYDAYLPVGGLLVWHIDFDLSIWKANKPNNLDSHPRIDLIEADDDKFNSTRSGDLFPGAADVCEFVSNVTPAFVDWKNRSTGYGLTGITRNFDGTISFRCVDDLDIPMEGADLKAPAIESVTTDRGSIAFSFPEVEGATEYYVSVFPLDKFDGVMIREYVPGMYYKPVKAADGMVSAIAEGLEADKAYGLLAYAANDVNASRTAAPFVAYTREADFEKAVTNLKAYKMDDEQHKGTALRWESVADATDYELTVVTRAAAVGDNAVESLKVDFSSNRMPETWNGTGKYDTRAKYSGEATPSYQLAANGSYLTTGVGDKQIAEVSFWCRDHFDDGNSRLDVYALDEKGGLTLAESLTDIAKEGTRRSVKLPAGAYGVKFFYFFDTTGLDFNIDDIEITYAADGFVDTPVAGVEISRLEDTCSLVSNLDSQTEYVAYVTPLKGETRGLRSHEVRFRPGQLHTSGVENIEEDAAPSRSFKISGDMLIPSGQEAYDLYSIDGICLGRGLKGATQLPAKGLYIVRSAGESLKFRI